MFTSLFAFTALPIFGAAAISVNITPHEQYSSSVGVLGCKINTNRVAYFPGAVSCDNICVKVTYAGLRSLNLLRVDSSAGANDISYDAWNYLAFGTSAAEQPHMGGGVAMDYEHVPIEECIDLLDDGKLPLSAANSMNYLSFCLQSNTWVGRNFQLRNIFDPACKYGYDEVCTLDATLQPHCPHPVGSMQDLGDQVVKNIVYGTGKQGSAA